MSVFTFRADAGWFRAFFASRFHPRKVRCAHRIGDHHSALTTVASRRGRFAARPADYLWPRGFRRARGRICGLTRGRMRSKRAKRHRGQTRTKASNCGNCDSLAETGHGQGCYCTVNVNVWLVW